MENVVGAAAAFDSGENAAGADAGSEREGEPGVAFVEGGVVGGDDGGGGGHWGSWSPEIVRAAAMGIFMKAAWRVSGGGRWVKGKRGVGGYGRDMTGQSDKLAGAL